MLFLISARLFVVPNNNSQGLLSAYTNGQGSSAGFLVHCLPSLLSGPVSLNCDCVQLTDEDTQAWRGSDSGPGSVC